MQKKKNFANVNFLVWFFFGFFTSALDLRKIYDRMNHFDYKETTGLMCRECIKFIKIFGQDYYSFIYYKL